MVPAFDAAPIAGTSARCWSAIAARMVMSPTSKHAQMIDVHARRAARKEGKRRDRLAQLVDEPVAGR